MPNLTYLNKLVKLNKQVILMAPAYFKVGISEVELLFELKSYFKNKGFNLKFAFRPIIAFGKNSAEPHHKAGKTELKKKDVVVVDIGLKSGNIITDLTRTFYFGKKNKKFVQVEKAIIGAQKKAIQSMKAGASCSTIDSLAREYLEKRGLAKYFVHGLGHGVGRKIHQAPYLKPKKRESKKDVLKISQKLTVEPGVYFPGKWGYRIEDMVVVRRRDVLVLSKD